MKHTQQSVALAGLLALALAISGCNAMRGGTSSGSSGSSGTTSDSGYETNKSTTSSPTSTSGSSGTTGNTGDASTTGVPETEVIQDGTGTSGASGMSGSTGSDTSSMQDDRGKHSSTSGAQPTKAVPNSTVLALEILPPSSGITEGDASMGTSGAAGATGSTPGHSYRVTVRMDDGSTQVVTHSTTPDFRSGDRINVTSGAIQR